MAELIRAIVGSGGKTTLIKRYAEEYRTLGKRVLITTSTHMMIEEYTLLTDHADEIIAELERKKFVMAGLRQGSKMGALPPSVYEKVCSYADIVLIEADGSKHKPVKYPAPYEPVIYDNVDEIVIVCGLHALGLPMREAAHRLELVKECLGVEEDTIVTAEHMKKLLIRGYIDRLVKDHPGKRLSVYFHYAEWREIRGGYEQSLKREAQAVRAGQLLRHEFAEIIERKSARIGCVIMASGQGKRFGSNKLLADFRGRTLIQTALDTTGEELFARKVVVTRSGEVAEICRSQGVPVILHDMPGRNDAVRLGIEAMAGMKGCLFCLCDQPLLTQDTLKRMTDHFVRGEHKIIQLGFGDRRVNPVLFAADYFEELRRLPEKRGGSYLLGLYPEDVGIVEAEREQELCDIDTREDLEELLRE